MPRIKPFPGIHPAPEVAGKVSLQLEELTLERAKAIRKENPASFINMLVPNIENPYLRGSKKELAYKKISENFEEFLDKGILVKEINPAVYVYQVAHKGLIQRGIWTITSIDDYLDNTVKKHELTRADREAGLVDYLRQTGIDANPVLIAYPENREVDEVIQQAMKGDPLLNFTNHGETHKLWKIDDPQELERLCTLFSSLGATYIADGHHRAAAACSYGIERRMLNLKHRGDEEYNFFTSVYMSTSQLRIFEFHRLVTDLGPIPADTFLERVSAVFQRSASPQNQVVKPSMPKQFGMYFNREWFVLNWEGKGSDAVNPVNDLDVSILQDHLLAPILNIIDPRTDSRLGVTGGINPIEELVEAVDSGRYTLAFTLYPTSISQLIAVADAGEVMPPKSTWFEPKFRAGLLIHEVD